MADPEKPPQYDMAANIPDDNIDVNGVRWVKPRFVKPRDEQVQREQEEVDAWAAKRKDSFQRSVGVDWKSIAGLSGRGKSNVVE